LYTTYFSSSKRETNELIGALGLGSKSPFAYTDSFNVISTKNGKTWTFSCVLGVEGVPQALKISEEETKDKPNGVLVSFPVKKEDIRIFSLKAAELFQHFLNPPTVIGGTEDFKSLMQSHKKEEAILLQGAGWKLLKDFGVTYRNYSISISLRMGQILYPVSEELLTEILNPKEALVFSLRQGGLILEAPLGSFDIAPSREELDYSPRTKEFLRERLISISEEISTAILAKLDSFPSTSTWDKTVFARKVRTELLQRGDGYSSSKALKDFDQKLKALDIRFKISTSKVYKRAYLDTRRRGEQVLKTSEWVPGFSIDVEILESTTFLILKREEFPRCRSRIKRWLLDNPSRDLSLIEAAEALKDLGNPPFITIEDLPVVRKPSPSEPREKLDPKTAVKYRVATSGMSVRETFCTYTSLRTEVKTDTQPYLVAGRGFNIRFLDKEYSRESLESLMAGVYSRLYSFLSRDANPGAVVTCIHSIKGLLRSSCYIIQEDDLSFWETRGRFSFETRFQELFTFLSKNLKPELDRNLEIEKLRVSIPNTYADGFDTLISLERSAETNQEWKKYLTLKSKMAPYFEAKLKLQGLQSNLDLRSIQTELPRLQGALESLSPSFKDFFGFTFKAPEKENQSAVFESILKDNYPLIQYISFRTSQAEELIQYMKMCDIQGGSK
jgi:hypothetical protein